MKKILMVIFSVAISLGLVLGDIPSLYAQETEEFTLEEITVTAQKREENLQKVAIAMDVVTGDTLREVGKNDIDEILSNISSVSIGQYSDGLRVSIRSMSNDNAPWGTLQVSTPMVAVNRDGVYSNRNATNTDLYDIERVEVLFGPQSTMYASSSPGGIVNVITTDPKLDTYEAFGSVEYGNYSRLKTDGALNAPLGDKMAIRTAFSTSIHDGYLTNGGMDEDSKAARIKLLFQPNDKISIVIGGEISNSGGQGFSNAAKFEFEDAVANPWTSESATSGNSMERKSRKIYANMNFNLGDFATLTLVPTYTTLTNYRSGATTSSGLEYRTIDQGTGHEKGFEARVASSPDFPIKWIVGLNIYKSLDDQHTNSFEKGDADPDVVDQITDRWNTTDVKAIYGNITYPFTERFRATAGIRKTWDDVNSMNHQIPGRPPTPLELYEYAFMGYDKPNYKLGFEYDLGASSMLFGDVTTSYRCQSAGSGGTTGKNPEEVTAFTLGSKSRFFRDRLQLNASVYYYDYKNYFAPGGPLQTIVDVNNNGKRDFIDTNGNGIHDPGETWTENLMQNDFNQIQTGDGKVYGLDLQASTIITANDKLDFNISYINKYFTKLVFDLQPITNWLGMPDIDYSGRPMTNAPQITATVNYSHTFSLASGGFITPRVEYRYSSEYVLSYRAWAPSVSRNPVTGDITYKITDEGLVRVQEPYMMSDVSVVYTNPDGRLSLALFIKNLRNYAVKRGLMMGGSFNIGPPRTYGATLSIRY